MLSEIPNVYIALPAMDEFEYLPKVVDCIRNQNYPYIKLVVCINQPDSWWDNPERKAVCIGNQVSIDYLESLEGIQIEIIDKSSKGKGWTAKKEGVGWARKTIMDKIVNQANVSDVIMSMDADTQFNTGYVSSIVENLNQNPTAVAISVPYYHELTGDEEKDRAILRYEIYMRYFALNLMRIGSPYAFTAIGSAIALPVSSYKAIGGITPHKSGEDFYFLQKLGKFGRILTWNEERVYPAARYSNRVGFGTGPAMIKGKEGDWSSYPIYPFEYFDDVEATYRLFADLFDADVPTPLDTFFEEKFGFENIWKPLRANFKTPQQFIRACHHKVDAFRVFQYLKWRNTKNQVSDEGNLIRFLGKLYPLKSATLSFNFRYLKFQETNIDRLNELRHFFMELEEVYQKENAL
ncbi:MAG: glycosyltransferase [Bacteroidales bacterium]